MTIEWLAGNRIIGTSTERTSVTGIKGATGGWKEIKRFKTGSTVTDLDVTGLGTHEYYMVLHTLDHSSGGQDVTMRLFNSAGNIIDGTSDYHSVRSENGGNDVASGGRNNMILADINTNTRSFGVDYISNIASNEKIQSGRMVYQEATGAGNVTERTETYNTCFNTSNMTGVRMDNGGWLSGSEVVVLAWDTSDTHTDNFWKLLKEVDVTSGSTISTGDFTPKKYLMVQYYLKSSGAVAYDFKFNSSTGSEYAGRHQNDGKGANSAGTNDYEQTNKTEMMENMGYSGGGVHAGTMFIVNEANQEKLVLGYIIGAGIAGIGVDTHRSEMAYKWTNATDQIKNITMINSVAVSKYKIQVWGSD